MKVAIVVPHIFMWDKILKSNIFAPGDLAVSLADRMVKLGHEVTLFTAGPVKTKAKVQSANLEGIKKELKKHNQSLSELIKVDLSTFKKLFKIIELEIISSVLRQSARFDIIHVYHSTSAEVCVLSKLAKSPIIFTLHDPFKMHFPNDVMYELLKNVKFTAISKQQKSLVPELNIIATVHNGIDFSKWEYNAKPDNYFIHYGRIIKPKGTHHAIEACERAGTRLRIVGPHYEGHGGDHYWSQKVKPHIDDDSVTYKGYIKKQSTKNKLLGRARALLFPITWDEPFGMVMLEANACGTPVITFDNGAVREIIKNGINGFIVKNVAGMVSSMEKIDNIDRQKCREFVEKRFSIKKMVKGYEKTYKRVTRNS